MAELRKWRDNSLCVFHGGVWTTNRSFRDRGKKRCPGTCRAPHCGNPCARTPHSMRASLDRIGCICTSKMCPHRYIPYICMHTCIYRRSPECPRFAGHG